MYLNLLNCVLVKFKQSDWTTKSFNRQSLQANAKYNADLLPCNGDWLHCAGVVAQSFHCSIITFTPSTI